MAGYVRADVRREQLLDAAERVLLRDGLDRLTLRAVAAEAGVRLSTLQYVFASRSDLVVALAHRVVAEARRDNITVGSTGLRNELHRLIDSYSNRMLANEKVAELIRSEFVAGANASLTGVPPEHPAGRPLLGDLGAAQVVRICTLAEEEYDVSPHVLARLWQIALNGLLWDFLREGHFDVVRAEGYMIIEWLVALAKPRPMGP